MKKYRKWLDENIIYLEASSDGSWEYWFRREDAKQGNKQNEDPQDKGQKSLKQFQSMLYVSSSNYQQWVLEAYWSATDGKITLKQLKSHKYDDWVIDFEEACELGIVTFDGQLRDLYVDKNAKEEEDGK